MNFIGVLIYECDLIDVIKNSAQLIADSFSAAHNEFSWPTIVTLVISLFSSITALLIAVVNFILFIKTEQKRNLLSRYERLLQIQIDNPKFENENYINDLLNSYFYNKLRKSEFVAYNRYCIFLFDFLKDLWIFCKNDVNKMNKIIIFHNYLIKHEKWIDYNCKYIVEAYSKDFYYFIKEQKTKPLSVFAPYYI